MTEDAGEPEGAVDGKSGTFLVTGADEGSAVLADVTDGQVHALSSNPGLAVDDVIEGVVAPDPPLEVSWSLVEVERRRSLVIETVEEPPGERARDLAPEEVGTVERVDIEAGELHVLAVPDVETAAREVEEDEATRRRAARLGASRVEIRSGDGVVSVRYLRA